MDYLSGNNFGDSSSSEAGSEEQLDEDVSVLCVCERVLFVLFWFFLRLIFR